MTFSDLPFCFENFLKKVQKKFADSKFSTTFAIPFEQRAGFFNKSSLIDCQNKYKQVPRTNESRALISLEIEGVRVKLRIIKYTKK
ncbi:MAG: hypothetical protein II095_06990, partial [Bacteroidales bacterium]|nr:hypothetical protein [Bacteroidales bacterium]